MADFSLEVEMLRSIAQVSAFGKEVQRANREVNKLARNMTTAEGGAEKLGTTGARGFERQQQAINKANQELQKRAAIQRQALAELQAAQAAADSARRRGVQMSAEQGRALVLAQNKAKEAILGTERAARGLASAMGRVDVGTRMATTSAVGYQKRMNMAGSATFQLSNAAQDLAIVLQSGGSFDRAILGAANNIGFLFTTMGPLAAILGTIGIIALPMVVRMFNTASREALKYQNILLGVNEALARNVLETFRLAEAQRELEFPREVVGGPPEEVAARERAREAEAELMRERFGGRGAADIARELERVAKEVRGVPDALATLTTGIIQTRETQVNIPIRELFEELRGPAEVQRILARLATPEFLGRAVAIPGTITLEQTRLIDAIGDAVRKLAVLEEPLTREQAATFIRDPGGLQAFRILMEEAVAQGRRITFDDERLNLIFQAMQTAANTTKDRAKLALDEAKRARDIRERIQRGEVSPEVRAVRERFLGPEGESRFRRDVERVAVEGLKAEEVERRRREEFEAFRSAQQKIIEAARAVERANREGGVARVVARETIAEAQAAIRERAAAMAEAKRTRESTEATAENTRILAELMRRLLDVQNQLREIPTPARTRELISAPFEALGVPPGTF